MNTEQGSEPLTTPYSFLDELGHAGPRAHICFSDLCSSVALIFGLELIFDAAETLERWGVGLA
jgi:hypothetical protein